MSLILWILLSFVNQSAVQQEAEVVLPSVPCLEQYDEADASYKKIEIAFTSGEAPLAGQLYLPVSDGPHPLVVLLPGGGNNVEYLRNTPNFFAPRFAHCSLAALTFDKRGTGESGGDYATSTFDDFINDAGAAIRKMAARPDIDADQIGVVGFSQGGRLAPIVAVRSPQVAFVASVSGPLTSVEDTRYFALENAFRRSQVSDSVLARVMPLWRQHLDFVAADDLVSLQRLDQVLAEMSNKVHPALLPPQSDRLPQTGIYNSMGLDFSTELAHLRVPWLSLYGEMDAVVPVQKSLDILHERMATGQHNNYSVIVVPGVSHSFVHPETHESVPFERFVFDWILKQVEEVGGKSLNKTH